ncbi:hypothetical protein B7463_g4398, partial [Scytalidium lignicola]
MPPKPFKPPRPSKAATASASRNSTSSKVTKSKPKPRNSTSTVGSARRSTNALPSLSPDSSQASGRLSSSPAPSVDGAQSTQRQDPKVTLPPKLLTRLLHEFFKHDNTRISQDAGVAIGCYMETFVREALARAAFAKEEEDGEGDGGGFLEHQLSVLRMRIFKQAIFIEGPGLREKLAGLQKSPETAKDHIITATSNLDYLRTPNRRRFVIRILQGTVDECHSKSPAKTSHVLFACGERIVVYKSTDIVRPPPENIVKLTSVAFAPALTNCPILSKGAKKSSRRGHKPCLKTRFNGINFIPWKLGFDISTLQTSSTLSTVNFTSTFLKSKKRIPQIKMQYTTLLLSALSIGSAMAQSGSVNVHVVEVAMNGTLTFSPSNVTAAVGDMVQFQFMGGNHTVTQSTFDQPCVPMDQSSNATGIFSGFQPVSAGAATIPTYTIQVNNTTPVWIYCSQAKHCQAGMVMVINEAPAKNASRTLENFAELASKATANLAPSSASNGTEGTVSSSSAGSAGSGTSTSTGSSTSTTPNAAASVKASGALGLGALLAIAITFFM